MGSPVTILNTKTPDEAAAIARRVESVCASWRGTSYKRNQRLRGVAVDCANFVVAVLDELYGVKLPPVPSLPDASADRADDAIAAIIGRYPHTRIYHSRQSSSPVPHLEAGDVVFTRINSREGHVLIVGDGRLWHAIADVGVCYIGFTQLIGTVDRIFRPLEKQRWIR